MGFEQWEWDLALILFRTGGREWLGRVLVEAVLCPDLHTQATSFVTLDVVALQLRAYQVTVGGRINCPLDSWFSVVPRDLAGFTFQPKPSKSWIPGSKLQFYTVGHFTQHHLTRNLSLEPISLVRQSENILQGRSVLEWTHTV